MLTASRCCAFLRGLLLFAVACSATIGWCQGTITGRVVYRNADGGTSPFRNGVIEMLDPHWVSLSVFTFRQIALTTTDGNGYFTINYNPHDEGGVPNTGYVDPNILAWSHELPGSANRILTNGSATVLPTQNDLPPGVTNLGTVIIDSGVAGICDARQEQSMQWMAWQQESRDMLRAFGVDQPNLYRTEFMSASSPNATYLDEDPQAYGVNSSKIRTMLHPRDMLRDTAQRHVGMQLLFHLFDARHDVNVFPAYVFEGASIHNTFATDEAFVHGFGAYISTLVDLDPVVEGVSAGGSVWWVDVETNYDGYGAANGNDDGSSDVAGRTGDRNAAAVAGMFYDLTDGSSTAADPFDRSVLPLADVIAVLDTYKPDGYNPPQNAMQFLDGFWAQGRARKPMVAGAAQIHGMTLDRLARPTIGLTAHTVSAGPFFWAGPLSGSMTVQNFGSQTYSSLSSSGAWHLRLDHSDGSVYSAGPMLGRSSGATTVAPGATATYNAATTSLWSATRKTGAFALKALYWGSDGVARQMDPSSPSVFNPVFISVAADTTAPTLTVTDDGLYQVARTGIWVRIEASEPQSAIARYEIAIGTAPGLSNVRGWQTITTSASSLPTYQSGFTVPHGTTVYATVRAYNVENLFSIASTDGITLGDTTPPTATVTDSGLAQSSVSSFAFSTTGQDLNGALTSAEYSLSTDPAIVGNIRGWTSIRTYAVSEARRNVTEPVTATGLALTPWSQVFVRVRWTNADGLSVTAVSDGIWIAPGRGIVGRVRLQEVPDAMLAGRQITFLVGPAGAPVQTANVTLGLNGGYAFPITPSGSVRIAAKGPLWLRHALSTWIGSGVAVIDYDLLGGDANGDNVVDVSDFLILAAAYETLTGGPGFDATADFNLDGAVNLDDFLILSSNYELSGAP